MSIVFDWLNPNKQDVSKIEVYRARSRGGAKTLLATLPPTALAYEDHTAEVNKVYFYSTLVYEGDLSTWSVEMPLASFENTGPGPQTLLRGSWEFGYFGSVDKSLVPTFTEVAAGAGISTDSTALNKTKVFHKWIVGGRIIFIPEGPITSTGTTWTATLLISKKLMPDVGQTDKDMFAITKGNDRFIVRVPYVDNRESAVSDGSLVISSAILTGDNGSYPVSELMALLCCFPASDTSKRLRVPAWYADSVIPDTTNFNSYLWTGTFYKTTTNDDGKTSRIMVNQAYLTTPSSSTAGFGRSFWPIYILDLS